MPRITLPVAGLLATLFVTQTLLAVQPTLTSIRPQGLQRGVETVVTFGGSRIEDAQELLFYSEGLTVSEFSVAGNKVTAKVKVAETCRLGIHAVRLRSATGVSNLRTFTVGPFAETPEAEPNNEFTAPQAVPMNTTVSGVITTEDVDYFVVDAKKGQRITAELEGIRLGITFFDAYVAILNEKRFELARSDDAALLRQDCLCSVIAPEDGKYIVQVRESSYGGDNNSLYRLHVGDFVRPVAAYPSGGRPGETIDVTWVEATGDTWQSQVTLPTGQGETVDVFASNGSATAPSPNRFRVLDVPYVNEAEPNNGRSQATAGAAPGAFHGVIGEPGDVDCFRFPAKKGQRFRVRVYARHELRTPLDSVVSVLRASNASRVGSNDDSGGPDSTFDMTVPADDDYVIIIRDHLRSGGPEFVYRIEVTPLKPQLTLSLPEKVRYVSTNISVPRGNRYALLVNAARANFGGDVALSFEDLPPGLNFEAVPMIASKTSVPVLLSAADDAVPAGRLAKIVGKPVDEKLQVVGQLKQRTMLVRGQNNRDVWGHDAERVAAVVAEPAPFKIDIVQPNVPIVRSGSMQLKVVATRTDGHKAPISIRMLYNPPGVSASGSISIPEGKNEASIPMTANGSAAIGSWPIVVVGRSRVGNGTVEVATQLATLEIADRFYDFAFQQSAGELGQEAELVVKVTNKQEYEGAAEVKLVGLPANTTTAAEPQPLTKDTTELVFKIKIDPKARPGIYKSLVCQTTLMKNNEPIKATLGTGQLRIDKPLPPKVAAKPKPKPQPKPQPVAQKEPPKKRLTRLEQLRQAREEAKKSE